MGEKVSMNFETVAQERRRLDALRASAQPTEKAEAKKPAVKAKGKKAKE